MRRRWAIAAVIGQFFVLIYMAAPREWALHFGRTIYLRTAPMDPRDVMRGDYVRLGYTISRVARRQCRDGLADVMNGKDAGAQPRWRTRSAFGTAEQSLLPPDTRVYAVLKPGSDGAAELDYLTDRRPADVLYLRGRLESLDESQAGVRYGLEAFFMEQGRALDLEQSQWRTGDQAPLEMAVALGPGGIGVLKGYRRGPLEVGLDLERKRTGDRQERVIAATIRLRNGSETNLALVILAENRSFALMPDLRWGATEWRWCSASDSLPAPRATNVVMLQPGQVFKARLDLEDPAWFVTRSGTSNSSPRALGEITEGWNVRFRFEYRPPPLEACATLPDAAAIWHGHLLTRTFTPTGAVD